MSAYDFFLPLGEMCVTSGNLRSNKLQFESFPFDWVLADTETAVGMIENNFAGFINLDSLVQTDTNVDNFHDSYLDRSNGINFVHAFKINADLTKEFPWIAARYALRGRRLIRRIKEAKKVLAVIATYCQRPAEYYEQNILRLRRLFPAQQIDGLVIEIFEGEGPKLGPVENLGSFCRYQILTPQPKDWGPLKPLWAKILKNYRLTWLRRLRYWLPDLVYSLRKLLLKLLAVLMPVPSWRAGLKQKTKRKFFE